MTPVRDVSSYAASSGTMTFIARWLGLTWEIAAIWYVIVVLTCVSTLFVFNSVRLAEQNSARQERLSLFLSELREKVETDIRLGFDIGEDRGAQTKIDELIRKDNTLRSIEIFDVTGKSRASTDRGTIGETVPAEWLTTISASTGAFWALANAEELVLGVPLKGGFSEVAGHIAVTYAPITWTSGSNSFPDVSAFWPFFLIFLLVFSLPFLVTLGYAKSVENQELVLKGERQAGDDPTTSLWKDATQTLLSTKQRLESVMQQLDRDQ